MTLPELVLLGTQAYISLLFHLAIRATIERDTCSFFRWRDRGWIKITAGCLHVRCSMLTHESGTPKMWHGAKYI